MANTPFSDLPRGKSQRLGMKPVVAGLVLLVLVAVATFWAFTKADPLDKPYRLSAVFTHAHEIKKRSPVRIAGVNVGRVTEIKAVPGEQLAKVTMEIEPEGLPIKRDSEVRLRPRLFLEGNYFIDIQPGTPSSPNLPTGSTIPQTQTTTPVQFGEFLTSLQRGTRENLQTLLKEYSRALEGPGAAGLNQAIEHWEGAYRNTAIVSRAYQGERAGDLHRLLRGQGRVFGALSANTRSLKTLVTGLRRVAGGFAREDANLSRTIVSLRNVLRTGKPALESLNDALPSLRAFARDALPAARSSLPTLNAQIP